MSSQTLVCRTCPGGVEDPVEGVGQEILGKYKVTGLGLHRSSSKMEGMPAP